MLQVEISGNAGDPDCIDWYAYQTEILWQLPLARHANQATHFLLLVSYLDPRSQVQFSADGTNWTDVAYPPFTSDTFAIGIPPDIAQCATAYARFLAPPGSCVNIGGWGLSTTNGPPLITFPQLAPVADQQAVAGQA